MLCHPPARCTHRWVAARCDPYRDPIPTIPREVILQTARVYIEAFERITGGSFVPPRTEFPVLDRIRTNLQQYF